MPRSFVSLSLFKRSNFLHRIPRYNYIDCKDKIDFPFFTFFAATFFIDSETVCDYTCDEPANNKDCVLG